MMNELVRFSLRLAPALIAVLISGCTSLPQQRIGDLEAPIVLGPSVRDNITPMEPVLACFADDVATSGRRPVTVAVGDVKDFTGRYSVNEGNAITQGGALMVYSALGKLNGVVQIAERFDPGIAERELAYADRRQLGDGRSHPLAGPGGTQNVPWLPYFGGSINQSDYFILGGITELNDNLSSGGTQAAINQIGIKSRIFTQSVGVDLRIVDTRTLMIMKTVSLTKQLNGYEVGVNIFRFFGSDLYDFDIGSKGQEPVQLGVRAALEESVLRLVSAVTQVDYQPCMALRAGAKMPMQTTPAAQLRKVPNPVYVAVPLAMPAPALPLVAPHRATLSGNTVLNESIDLPFAFGATTADGGMLSLLDRIRVASEQGETEVVLLARDTEVWDSGKRDRLTDQRLANVIAALAERGIAGNRISVTWRPSSTDSARYLDGPGLQQMAKLRVSNGGRATAPVISPVVK